MSVLELFSGTNSVGKVCKEIGWKTVSVDLIMEADHKCDIMDFDYKQYPRDHFDVVWASPPCTAYSNLQNCWLNRERKGKVFTKERMEEDRKEADKLVLKTLEIIDYFKPSLWFIENPQTGQLRKREIMKDIPFYDVDYCMYSDWGYRKRTRIWTNKPHFSPKLCDGKGTCGNMVEINNEKKQHKTILGNGYEMIDGKKTLCNTKELRDKFREKKQMTHNVSLGSKANEKQINMPGGSTNLLLRYRIPQKLIYELLME